MKEMEEKILQESETLPGNILKVGSFLNQQLDMGFLMRVGEEIARLYRDSGVTKILTIEASGIAIAMAAALKLDVPMVFAKKNDTANGDDAVYTAQIHSYTRGNDYVARVGKRYLSRQDKVLLVDDFLANGAALHGLLALAEQAGCQVAGAAIAIEKGFQEGGDGLRRLGLRVESLAIIESMGPEGITFRQA